MRPGSRSGQCGSVVSLDISGLIRDHANTSAMKQSRYELRSIVIHSGSSVDCGHYYAVTRNGDTNQWMRVDDTYVTSLPKEKIPSLAFGSKSTGGRTSENYTYGCPTAYMLFYSKKTDGNGLKPAVTDAYSKKLSPKSSPIPSPIPSPTSSPSTSELKTFRIETQTAQVSFSNGSTVPPQSPRSPDFSMWHLLEPITLKKVPKQSTSAASKPVSSPTTSPKHAHSPTTSPKNAHPPPTSPKHSHSSFTTSSPKHAHTPATSPKHVQSRSTDVAFRADPRPAAQRSGHCDAGVMPERATESQAVLSVPTRACPSRHSQTPNYAMHCSMIIDARTGQLSKPSPLPSSAVSRVAIGTKQTRSPSAKSQGSCRNEEANSAKVIGKIRVVC
ncbi:hypothetical protein CBR_g395 [Chara braunii]|uniref:USP domain-containing protein n=1 Tax=Chara braunii TaxID=69332 RepID=A0A388JQI0_CHABU|nr:hypothetical protein CBR_g395 [Chara braunii]|eukprot:GBG60064.1 hypothetical protein CBR_g395 [Chara braunii]